MQLIESPLKICQLAKLSYMSNMNYVKRKKHLELNDRLKDNINTTYYNLLFVETREELKQLPVNGNFKRYLNNSNNYDRLKDGDIKCEILRLQNMLFLFINHSILS